MHMHLLSGGRLRMRKRVYYPDAERDATIELPVISVLLKHRHGNVLFDTGCHPDIATNAEARWGGLAKVMVPIFDVADTVIHQLPHAGLVADDIDVVICSHLHTDHCGCNSFFPRATVICHADELATARASDAVAMGFFPADWDQDNRFDALTGARDLFGDGAVTLLPMPGHTPGMLTAHVVLDSDGDFLLASDAAPLAVNLATRHVPRNSWDIAKTAAALDEIARLQAGGTTVIYGHDDAQWQAARTGAAFYS